MKCLIVFVGLLKLKTTSISNDKIEYNPSNIFPYKFPNYGTMIKYRTFDLHLKRKIN